MLPRAAGGAADCEAIPSLLDRAAYRVRSVVERPVGQPVRCQRVATRYAKRAANHLATPRLGAILLRHRGGERVLVLPTS